MGLGKYILNSVLLLLCLLNLKKFKMRPLMMDVGPVATPAFFGHDCSSEVCRAVTQGHKSTDLSEDRTIF